MAVLVILKYLTALDTPGINMVQRAWYVNAGLSEHVGDNTKNNPSRKVYKLRAPPVPT